MDLAETMKSILSKNPGTSSSSGQPVNSSAIHSGGGGIDHTGAGFVTEKLYMLLQLYLQNKGWNPSVELLQCFSELKDSALLPSAAYLQVLANRLALDSQGRLVLRESGKIVLPYEHFANAVMLKHMAGPHGLHLSIEATLRAVMESYTIGRENFGMEKEFIVEVVQSCPSPACRYYKNHLGGPFIDQTFPAPQPIPDFMSHLPQQLDFSSQNSVSGHENSSTKNSVNQNSNSMKHPKTSQHNQQQQQQQHQQQQQITAAIIQQQNRAIAQQSLEKFGNLSALEKQRVLQQFDKKNYDLGQGPSMPQDDKTSRLKKRNSQSTDKKFIGLAISPNIQSSQPGRNDVNASNSQTMIQNHLPPPSSPQMPQQVESHKNNEYLRGSLECLESLSASNKDLLALHNGAWTNQDGREPVGQDKIVRAFSELMKNMARMKTFIRPSMCKPYGKQSESLQKTLVDTIQLVQSLRSCLPAPHISVGSYKNDDQHRKSQEMGTNLIN